jgi:DNA-binding transcriptional LysR family regulator
MILITKRLYMRISLRQLKVFLMVAKCLNYTRASERLFMSQPAVSKQIKQLEEEVGVCLFEKVGKKIFLTEAGHDMQSYANSILGLVSEAKDHFSQVKGGQKGRLKVAVATTASSFAIDMLGQFRKTYSEVDFDIEVTNRQTLLSHLDRNLVDLVIMGQPPENNQYSVEPFMKNPLVFIAPIDHPLVGERVTVGDLIKESFVAREEGSGTRQAMDAFFEAQAGELQVGMLFNSNESIKSAVASGFGLALVSVHTIQAELEHASLAILDVENTPIQRFWYLVHLKEKRLSAVAETFRNFILGKAV